MFYINNFNLAFCVHLLVAPVRRPIGPAANNYRQYEPVYYMLFVNLF